MSSLWKPRFSNRQSEALSKILKVHAKGGENAKNGQRPPHTAAQAVVGKEWLPVAFTLANYGERWVLLREQTSAGL